MSFREQSLRAIRRDVHAHPESGWTEFRTTALVAEALADLGFDLHLGVDAVAPGERLGVPDRDELASAIERARSEGAPATYLDRMDGVTGLVAVREWGDGPTVGVGVDVDALERQEAMDDDHRPAREGFASRHPGEMHARGHDGHVAIGVGVARELHRNGGFDGTLKLFFQPAEEGNRGGKPMSESGHLDDVDHLLALHLGVEDPAGTVVAGYDRPPSNAGLTATFSGGSAHAGPGPAAGGNAVRALGTAIQNLSAIPRHGDGATRVTVGSVAAGDAPNAVGDVATVRVEVRGESAALNDYMLDRARAVVENAAAMHGCSADASLFGTATTFECDPGMVDRVAAAADRVAGVDDVERRRAFDGSEDASFLVRRVQERGGTASYVGVGAAPAGQDTADVDIDEDALAVGVDVVCETVRSL